MRRFFLVLIVLPFAALSACGLFSDSDDTELFTGADAGTPHSDTSVGGHDAKVDTGKRVDAAAPVDAGMDRSVADAGHDARDANLDVVSDHATHDAAHDSAKEASIPFCPSQVFPSGAFVVCDDFDENPDAKALGQFYTTSGSSIALQQSTVKSPPNALAFTVHPVGNATTDAILTNIPSGNRVTLEMDLLLDLGAADGGVSTNYNVGINFSSGSSVYLIIGNGPDAGPPTVNLEEDVPLEGEYYIPHNFVAWPSGWAHIQINLETSGGQVTDTWFLNGAQVDGSSMDGPFVCNSHFSMTGEASTRVGLAYASGVNRTAYIDNVIVTSSE